MRFLAFFILLIPTVARPAEAIVAVAANFAPALEALRVEFEATSPHVLKIASGSTGKLSAQIVNGAPFDLFLAADSERPRRLEASGIRHLIFQMKMKTWLTWGVSFQIL